MIFKKLQASETEHGELFENKTLDNLSRIKPLQAILYYGSIWGLLIGINIKYSGLGFGISLVVYFLALLSWTLFEYLAHRFLFHFENEKPWVKRMHRAIHGIHHEYPRDTTRLIMPAIPGTLIVLFLFGVFYLMMGIYTYIFLAGFIHGWSIYVSIHYIIHAYQPVPGFKILWTHHAKHHYKEGDKAFGVSSVLWDKIFGTMPD